MGQTGTVVAGTTKSGYPVAMKLTPLDTYLSSSDCPNVKQAIENKKLGDCSKETSANWAKEVTVTNELARIHLGPKLLAAWTCTGYDADFPIQPIVFGVMSMEQVPGLSLNEFVLRYRWSAELENVLLQMLQLWFKSGWYHGDLHGRNVMIQFSTSSDKTIPISARAIDVGSAKPELSRLPNWQSSLAHLKDDAKSFVMRHWCRRLSIPNVYIIVLFVCATMRGYWGWLVVTIDLPLHKFVLTTAASKGTIVNGQSSCAT
jgi:hypothetical protein